MMRTVLIVAAAVVLFLSLDEIRSFDSMSDEERLVIGSAQLGRACAAASNAHELGLVAKLEIRRGHDYLSYVTACLEVEGMDSLVEPLILSAGSDEQVEAIIQSVASPRSYCSVDFTRRFTSREAERLGEACHRLGLR